MAPRIPPKSTDQTGVDEDELEEIVQDGDEAEENADDGEDAISDPDEEVVVQGEEPAEDEIQEAKVTKSAITPDPAAKPALASHEQPKTAAPEVVKFDGDNGDELSDHILSSPQAFGIWVEGELHQFKKGKTRLTNKQKYHVLRHQYVRDNGASVLKMKKA